MISIVKTNYKFKRVNKRKIFKQFNIHKKQKSKNDFNLKLYLLMFK